MAALMLLACTYLHPRLLLGPSCLTAPIPSAKSAQSTHGQHLYISAPDPSLGKREAKRRVKSEAKVKRPKEERDHHQTCPEMEDGGSPSIIPYAKQSRMVSRYPVEKDPGLAIADCAHSNFWDRLVQQQSSHWTEEYREAPSLLMSGCVVQRPAEAEGDPSPWQMISTAEKLPSPKELCRRRRKKGAKRQRLEKGGIMSVCYHLEELKRRQSYIDELKKSKWGGCLPQPLPEGNHGTGTAGPPRGAPLSPFSMPGSTAQLYETEDPVFQRHSHEKLLHPEWSFGMRERQRILPGSLAFSSSMATLGRYPTVAACMPEEDFGGFQLQLEE